MNLCRILVVSVLTATVSAGAPTVEELKQEQRRIEDIRVLHYFSIATLHEARALAVYLEAWGGPDRDHEVESLVLEAEGLYGHLRGIDNGGLGLQAVVDVHGPAALRDAHMALLQQARGGVAGRIWDFHQRCIGLADALAAAVHAAAAVDTPVKRVDAPWEDPQREAGRLNGLRFGAWLEARILDQPESHWDEYLSRFRRAGLTFANVYWLPAGDWALLEPEPGEYDFSPLDRVVSACARHDLRVALKLATLSGAPPAWHVAAEPESRLRVETRKPGEYRAEGINLHHGPTRERFEAFVAAFAAHLRERWADWIEAVYVDGGRHELGWPFASDGALSPSRREARLARYLAVVTDALHRGWPSLAVQGHTVSHDFHRLFALRTEPGRDLYRLAQFGGNPTTQTDSPASYNLLRSLAGGRWLWHEAIHTGCGTIGAASMSLTPLHDAGRVVVARGHNVIRASFPRNWFRYPDFQFGDSGIGSYYMAVRRCAALGPTAMSTRAAPADVAVLWSQTTRRLEPDTAHYRGALAWGHLLSRIFVPVDYLDERELAATLDAYKLLILPSCQYLSAADAAAVAAWVEGGGILWGFGAPGLYDETGARHEPYPFAGVFGATVARLRVPAPVTPDRLVTTHPEGAFQTRNTPPRPYKFDAAVYAALAPSGAEPRAWFAGVAREPAIVTFRAGEGRSMLCGFPVGYEYWQASPYECALGVTHNRLTNYHEEQKRYEQWVVAELNKVGIRPPVSIPEGRMLRTQRGDDPDWFHVYRNAPAFRDYFYETDKPVRTVYAVTRVREGMDDLYVGLAQTEGNYMWERGYVRSTLAGCRLQVAVRPPAEARDWVYDIVLDVPVPAKRSRGGDLLFRTWLPVASAGLFAVPAGPELTLFNGPGFAGEEASTVAARVAEYRGPPLPRVRIVDAAAIRAFLDARRGKRLRVGCDVAHRPAAAALSDWLRTEYGIELDTTVAGPRLSNRFAYMDGFGYPNPGPEPVAADIVMGNCQDTGLMRRFITVQDDVYWLPLEVNRDFPGAGRALIMLSLPVTTRADGKPGGRESPPQLVIGCSHAGAAETAVAALREAMQPAAGE